MRNLRFIKRVAVWALAALLVGVAAPTISTVMAAGASDEHGVAVCTAEGTKWISLIGQGDEYFPGVVDRTEGSSHPLDHSDHCPFCHFSVVVVIGAFDPLRFSDPTHAPFFVDSPAAAPPLFGWAQARSRAPPSRSYV